SVHYDAQSSTRRIAPCHRGTDVRDFLPAISQGETLGMGKLLDCGRRVQLDSCAVDNRLTSGAQPLDDFVSRPGAKCILELLFRGVVGNRRRDVRSYGSVSWFRARHGDGARLLRSVWDTNSAHISWEICGDRWNSFRPNRDWRRGG